MKSSIKLPDFHLSAQVMQKKLKTMIPNESLTIGIHAKEGRNPVVDPRTGKQSGITLAEKGAINHFGQGRIPARPFLDVGVKSVRNKIAHGISETIHRGGNWYVALGRAGVIAANGVKEYITEHEFTPNSPVTIAKKGSSHPLIDSGQMRASITFMRQPIGSVKKNEP